MGLFSKPKAPTPPNLTALATTQGQINKDAAFDIANANRYTQQDASGATNKWITDPTTGAVSNVTSMGAPAQALYSGLMGDANTNLGTFQNKYWGGAGGGGSTPVSGGGGSINLNFGSAGGDASGSPIGKGIQKDLDYSHLTAMPTTDPAVARQQAQDALYGMNKQYLDPQWQASQSALATKLSNQGLVPGTPAYNRAMQVENDAQQKAYGDARLSSIAGGGAEAERAQQMALALRNQGVTEAGNLGAFHNAAQDQGAQQWLKKYGYDTGLQGTLGAAGINASAANYRTDTDNALNTRAQEFNELMQMGSGAQKFLPQFPTAQGNVQSYKPADVLGAGESDYANAMAQYNAQRAQSNLIPQLVGGVAGAFLGGPAGAAAGKSLFPSVFGG